MYRVCHILICVLCRPRRRSVSYPSSIERRAVAPSRAVAVAVPRVVAARSSRRCPVRDSRRSLDGPRAMDKYRKQQRKREIEKNKERRKEARAVAAQTKDLSELQAERERLEKAKNAPQIPGQRLRVDKIDEKLTWLSKQIDAKRASDARDREAGLTPRSAKPRGPTSTAYAVGAEQYYKPEDSVYWHPKLNPTGRPPAGKPQKWKAGIVVDECASASRQALPAATAASDGDSDSDSDGDAMPPPPGPPPGFELVIPALPVKDDAIAAAKTDTNDEDEPLLPPSAPPDHEDEPLPPPPVPAGDEDGSDSEALPPPPMPPTGTSSGNEVEVAPPRVTETTTVVRRAPVGSMPRVVPVQRRPPPPPKHGVGGFFAAAPRAVRKPPSDPATFTKSAAPTATPIVRAEHNVKLKALVPASVRVNRQEAPNAKRQRVVTGRAINAAPKVAASSSAGGSGKAADETYLSFLDEMSELGAFAE